MGKHWKPGDTIILRHVPRRGAWPYVLARPKLVVRDTDELTLLYEPEGAKIVGWHVDEQRFMEPWVMRMDFLTLIFPGKAYLVHLVFDAGSGTPPWYEPYFSGEDRFRGWKVDLVTPLRRTGRGFDCTDEVLDIIVRPDRSWYWKDEDQMARYLATGVYMESEVEQLRRVGSEVIALVETAKSPFDDEWTNWLPTPELVLRDIPDGWHLLPDR